VEVRVSRLEEGVNDLESAVGEVQTTTNGLEATGAGLEPGMGPLQVTTAMRGERLGRVETGIAEIKSTLPHLATKADVTELRLSTLPGLAELRSEVVAGFADKSGRTDMCDILAGPWGRMRMRRRPPPS
jgi:hypothetical protein